MFKRLIPPPWLIIIVVILLPLPLWILTLRFTETDSDWRIVCGLISVISSVFSIGLLIVMIYLGAYKFWESQIGKFSLALILLGVCIAMVVLINYLGEKAFTMTYPWYGLAFFGGLFFYTLWEALNSKR